jgi:hypothetical protein
VEVRHRGASIAHENLAVRPAVVPAAAGRKQAEAESSLAAKLQAENDDATVSDRRNHHPLGCPPALLPKLAAQTAAQGFAPADTPTDNSESRKGHF